jgi:2,3-diaminopropionate biosynthesis protein SbnB
LAPATAVGENVEVDGGDILVLRGEEVRELLSGQEHSVLAAVRSAYVAHANGQSSLPHSSFVRFPGDEVNRIIALPGFLGDGFDVAGLKWIASFPANVEHGLARASAVLILNSRSTGQPEAVLEGSLISAARTAASAAAAAALLLAGEAPECVGLIGAGPINLAITRYLRAALPGTARFLVHDLDPGRAAQAMAALRRAPEGDAGPAPAAEVAGSVAEVLRRCPLVSFATSATRPHVADLSGCPRGAALLHVSLRDLTPQAILGADNVVDDPDHVCRAQTSVHLAEQATGSRDFIRCTLADIIQGRAPARRDGDSVAIFSPFGLGVLDLAVGKLVRDLALARGQGDTIQGFHPRGAFV